MSAQAPLRVGLVGFGRLARKYYVPALRAWQPRLHLAIADPATESLDAARRLWPGASTYRDHRALLDGETQDALLVASPPSTHLAVWRDAAAFALPVFMEKPFPLTHEIADIDPSDPSWARLMIDFNRRFWRPYRQIAELVRGDHVGAVISAEFRLMVDPRRWGTVSNHRLQPGEGGALHDLGSQTLDLAMMVLGEHPRHLRTVPTSDNGDTWRIDLDWPGGALAHCEFGYSDRGQESVLVKGERGTLRLGDPNFAVHRRQHASALARLGDRARDLAMLGYRGLFRGQSMMRCSIREALFSFLRTVGTNARGNPGIEDALRVARLLALAA